jgi:hypothetical protein
MESRNHIPSYNGRPTGHDILFHNKIDEQNQLKYKLHLFICDVIPRYSLFSKQKYCNVYIDFKQDLNSYLHTHLTKRIFSLKKGFKKL